MTRATAIVPARGGSKRVPRKNCRPFCGRPMIEWPLRALLSATRVDSVVVSTDDDEIAAIASDVGAQVPFIRPPHLSEDHATTIDVIRHAIEELGFEGRDAPAILCVYPTSVFITPARIDDAVAAYVDSGRDFLVSVTEYSHPVQRAFEISTDGGLRPREAGNLLRRTQDLNTAYHDAAQFYIARPTVWRQSESVFSSAPAPYVLPKTEALDIDTREDLLLAEIVFTALRPDQGGG